MFRHIRTLSAFRTATCLVALISNSASSGGDEFRCPEGARDSGDRPGAIVRWCEIEKDGRLLYHGPVWRWYRNGALESKENYVYGAADGDTPSWYENGKKSSFGRFERGSKVGLWKYWDEQGRLTTEVTYGVGGHQKTDYYPDGGKKATGTFRSSGKVGTWTYWDPAGKRKARCDFGDGVFTIRSKPCQLIADELDPKGYSRPVANGSVGPVGACSLRIANQRYEFSVPAGWVADADSGRKDDVPLVFYRVGSSWKGDGPQLYVRPVVRDGASFEQVQQDESEGFQAGAAEYSETAPVKKTLPNGMEVSERTVRYKPLIETDSPFAIVASSTIHELVVYINASAEVVLMAVLTSPTESDLSDFGESLGSLVGSMRARKH